MPMGSPTIESAVNAQTISKTQVIIPAHPTTTLKNKRRLSHQRITSPSPAMGWLRSNRGLPKNVLRERMIIGVSSLTYL